APGSPAWLQGLRALWSPLLASRDGRGVQRPAAAYDSLVSFLDVGGLNLLAGDADPWATDTVRARRDERDLLRPAWGGAVAPARSTRWARNFAMRPGGPPWPGSGGRGRSTLCRWANATACCARQAC